MTLIRLIAGLLLLCSGTLVSAQCTLRFSGRVSDADTREQLGGATIEIKEAGIKKATGDNGQFTIEGLCPGHYDVLISHTGCQPLRVHIHIKDDFTQEFLLAHASGQLAAVTVVSVAGSSANQNEIKGKALDAVKGLTLGESLKGITGISVLQTGTNIYKPVIHGLHSNRVLILNNGIRQEGQQWGNEHAPEVDPYIANRISVIKGAATMRYGGDAIGGVILVEPRLLRAVPGTGGELNIAAFSNNRMGNISAVFEGNPAKKPAFSWRLQGTLKKGGNASTPRYRLGNSGVQEYNFSATAGWRKNKWGTELFYSQFNTKLGIFSGSHIGNVTDLIVAINSTEPPDYIRNAGFTYAIDRPYQAVQHHLLKSKTYINTGTFGRLNLVNSFQYNNRLEYDKKRFQSSEDVPQLDLSIATATTDLVWDHFTWKKFRGTIGITGTFQDNRYSRRLFIPNYQSVNAGVFWIEKWEHKKWTLEGGLRYDYKNYYNISSNAGGAYPEKNYSNVSGNAGLVYKSARGLIYTLSLSAAWRAPTINELYSDGLHHGAARLEKGNAGLQPERARSIMAGLSYNGDKWMLELGLYTKFIADFIYLEPTYPPQLTIRGAFPSFQFSQTNAVLSGADIMAGYEITHHLHWKGKASLLRARNRTKNEWMIQMPADRFENELEYSFRNGRVFKESYVQLQSQVILQQNRIPASGPIEITRPDGTKYMAPDYAPPPGGYFLVGIEAGSQITTGKKSWTVTAAVTNLLNKVYRDYMNAFRYYADEMGRNISLRIKIPIEFKKTGN